MNARILRLAAVALALSLAVTAGVWLFFRSVEPVYNGKPLTFWAQQYGSNYWIGSNELAREAEIAIRKVGPNAIPFLLDLMQARDSELKKTLRQRVPRKWHDRLPLLDNSWEVRRMGAHGFAALGTNATTAVPELIKLATQHPEEDGRYNAVFALRALGRAAEGAIPFYIECLTNKHATIRNEAALALALMRHRHYETFPAFLKYLKSMEAPDEWEIKHAIGLLREFGTNAQSAMPRLLSLLNDSNPNVREEVTNALIWIDPAAAEKAQVRRR